MLSLGVWITVGTMGAVIGSTLNMLIYRVPRRLNVLWGRSSCPKCKHHLSVIDLIPILSFCVQLGRCRYCRKPFGIRYLIVEVLCVVVSLACVFFYGIL